MGLLAGGSGHGRGLQNGLGWTEGLVMGLSCGQYVWIAAVWGDGL